MTSLEPRNERFMVSADGNQADWFHPTDIAARAPDWTDCTDMSAEQLQRHIAKLQAVRPHIVGVQLGAASRQSPEEAREAHIATLTEQLFLARLSILGNPAVLREVSNSVFEYLTHAEDQHRLVLGEVSFTEVRDRVMRDEAEVDAIRAVERMERNRAEDERQAEVERGIWERTLAAVA